MGRARTAGGPPARGAPRESRPPGPIPGPIEDHEDEEVAASGFARRAGRFGWGLLVVLLPILLLTGLAAGLGYVRLLHGPISLKPLAGPIARSLSSELPGLDVRIGDAILRLASDGQFEFRLKDVRLFERDGDLVASAPEAAAHLSTDGLWSGRVVPSRIYLIEPKLRLGKTEDGSLALTFTAAPRVEADEEQGGEAKGTPDAALPETAVVSKPATPHGSPQEPAEQPASKRIDLARVLAESSRRARRGLDATSYLREVGLRNATISFDNRGHTTRWLVPEASVDLEHKQRSSVIAGLVKIASSRGPWSIAFRTEEHDRTRTLVVKSTLRDFMPSALPDGWLASGLLQSLDLPIASDITLELTSEGDLISGEAQVELGRGRIGDTRAGGTAIDIDGGLLNLVYRADDERIELKPSPVRWAGNQMTLKGAMKSGATADGRAGWTFDIASEDGTLSAVDIGAAAISIDRFRASGHWLPQQGRMQLSALELVAGGAEVAIDGEIDAEPHGMRIEGRAGAASLDTFKALWPRSVAPHARAWVGKRIESGSMRGTTFQYLSGSYLHHQNPGSAAEGDDRLTMAIEAADVMLRPLPGMPPVEVPKALINIADAAVEVSAPDAAVAVGPNRRVPLKSGRFYIADARPQAPDGELTFRVQNAALQPVLAVLNQPPLALLDKAGQSFETLDGKVEAQLKLAVRLDSTLDADDFKIEGKAKVSDLRGKQAFAGYDVQGGTINFDLAEQAIDAKGEMLISGVLAKVSWQHLYDAEAERQPPLRILSTLDNSDRNQLGLDIAHIVQGEVPVEVTVTQGLETAPQTRLRADLTAAELTLDGVAWKKPRGRPTHLQFDVVKGRGGRTELANVKLAGDDVAIEGTAVLGPDNRLREFHFPDFTLNVVSRLDVQGKLSSNNVWDIKARGTTFDGRDFFRSLFNVGERPDRAARQQKPRDGIDLEAEVDTVLGYADTSLKGLRIKASKRGDRLVALDARGTLDGGKALAAALRIDGKDQRHLLADTTDAGQAFKLVGFYPNAQGGRARLDVNLDGRGAAEKTGILWVEDFYVLGDPVVAEVVGSAGDDPIDRTGNRTRQRIVRQAFKFDRMKAPFSVGHGQFVLDDSYVKGPILGANIRGKVDYGARTVQLGGTYVPLQGLNNVLGDIPLLGQILSGPRNEGIFGITFAIQGPMAAPQVIVNPLSLLTPGITRELTQMAPIDSAVQVREDPRPAGKSGSRTRASSTPAESVRGATDKAGPKPKVLDGWSSETRSPSSPKKK